MRVLVTGGLGFVGAQLTRALLRDGHEVVVFDNLCATHSRAALADVADRYAFVHGDVRAPEDLDRAGAAPFDRVYHLAASFANELSEEHPLLDARTNVDGTLHALAYARRVGCGLFVYTGSSSSYGDAPTPFAEDGPARPSTSYAMTKLLGEHHVRGSGLPHAVLRLFNVYGPGDAPGRYRNAIPNMVAAACAPGGALRVFGRDATRDFTEVGDVVRVLLRAERATGHTVNVGTGVETRVLDLARMVLAALDLPPDRLRVEPPRPWDRVARRSADVTRLRALFGEAPSTPLSEGLPRTVSWLRAQGHARPEGP